MTRRIVLPPSAPAHAKSLVFGELLAGGELGRRAGRARVETGRAQGGQGGRDSEERAPVHADAGEPLLEQIQLAIGNIRGHGESSFREVI